MNGDGSITISDVNMVMNYYLAEDKPSDFNFAAADVNGDGYITMSDANQIANMYFSGVSVAEYQVFTEKLNIKDNQNVIRGYRYVYNDANRLRGAAYSEERTDGTTPTQTPNYGAAFLYDANGNIGHIYRYGKKQNSEYGYVDNIVLSYTGNQLTSVKEKANSVTAERSTDYKGEKDVQTSCTYNGVGSLTSDEGRKIALIKYDNMNNPSRIQFTNGNVTKYVYSATGEKLRTVHQTAAPNITVAVGTAHELTASELLYTDSTDYYCGGKLTVKNGRMDKYFFDGGYAQAKTNETTLTDNFSSYYYNTDHLGNVREVIDEKGDIVQITNYYPFGTPYSAEDFATHNPDQQDRKYNGKEFDSTHGLNTYDYGARQYCSLFGRWDRMDPLCEKYYSVSPYAYCANNPIRFIDNDGKDYDVYYNGSSITISATYFTDEYSAESARNAVSFWNNLNGQFTMDGLPVSFDFKVSVVSSADIPEGVKTNSFIRGKANMTVSGNVYMLANIPDANKNGETNSGRLVTVAEGRASSSTGAHEIGHSVGLQHSNAGLMTPASSDPSRANKISKGEIKTIIQRAVKGTPLKDENGNSAGKGYFHNISEDPNIKFKYKMEELKK